MTGLNIRHAEVRHVDWLLSIKLPPFSHTGHNFSYLNQSQTLIRLLPILFKHFVEDGGEEGGGVAVGLGAQLPQLVRFVQ